MVLSRTTLLGVHICTHSFIYIHTSWWRNKLHVGHMWRRQWHPTPVLLPRKSHWWRSLVGCGPWGRWELDTTERLHFHFSLSCIEEGNGNPLQCSCLENPRDGGALWAAVYGVSQGQTRLKRLSQFWSRKAKVLWLVSSEASLRGLETAAAPSVPNLLSLRICALIPTSYKDPS